MMWVALSAIMLVVSGSAGALECEANHDCPQEQFCYGQTNRTRTCTPCISCAFYKRAVVAKPTCAHTALDCGHCLPGFHEEPLTDSRRHYCMPTPLPEQGTVSGAAPSLYLVGSVLFVIVVLTSVACFIWVKNKRISSTASATNALQEVENAVCNQPPAYEETRNCLPLLETVASYQPTVSKQNESSFSLQVDGKCEESLAQANPFKWAREPYLDTNNCTNSDQESTSSGLSDTESSPSPNAPDLNDEETVPSTWTYHDDIQEPTTGNGVLAEEANDSGLSLAGSRSTSVCSLADPLRLPGVLFPGFSFSGCIQPTTERVGLSSRKQQQSPESPSAMKRARRNSSPTESSDSDEASESDKPLDRVMV